MRTLVAALLLFVAGCGSDSGPVTAAEIKGFIGRPVGDAVKRLGAPDRDEGCLMTWKAGGTAAGKKTVCWIQYDSERGVTTSAGVGGDPEAVVTKKAR